MESVSIPQSLGLWVSFGRVVAVIQGQALWRVRALWGFHLLTCDICRERDTEDITSQVGILHSSHPSGNRVTKPPGQ